MNRYERNYSSISKREQEILGNTSIAIVGLGGLGGYVLENLVRLGVRKFHLIDKDIFEKTNLNRQILATEENLGKSKAEEGLLRAKKINREVEVKVFHSKLHKDSIKMLQGVHMVVDCLDSIEGRLQLEELCEKMDLYLIHGAIRGYYGQVGISSPENRMIAKIYGGAPIENETLGNLPMTCMVIASFQVRLLLKILFNEEIEEELILIDCRNMEIERLTMKRRD